MQRLHLHMTRVPALAALAIAMLAGIPARGQTTTMVADSKGTWTVTTNTDGSTPNDIKITFTPDANNVNCAKIVFVQTCRITFDGVPYNPADIIKKWEYRRDDTSAIDPNDPNSGGVFIDHIFCEKDPGYNGDDRGDPNDPNVPRQDGGSQGKAQGDGTGVTSATMYDKPYISDGAFPAGTTTCVMEFETCAMCASGADSTSWTSLGCIKWKYTRTKGGGDSGTSTIVSTGVEVRTTAHSGATTTFDSGHRDGTTTKCPEDLDPNSCPNRVNGKTGPLLFHVNTNYDVEKAGGNVKKGRNPPDNGLPNGPIGNSLTTCDYVYVPNGESINIKRKGGSKSPPAGGPRDVPATHVDLMQGEVETTESGVCVGTAHCGVRVADCSNTITLASIAPVNSFDPLSPILYTVTLDDATDTVVIRNDPLSAGIVAAQDVFHGMPPQTVAPGQIVVYAYPGMILPCDAIAPPTGACCTPSGLCTVTPPFACTGLWLGPDSVCDPNPCPPPLGCKGDSNCDTRITWRDIDYFVAAQNNNVSAWYARFLPGSPSCPYSNNDIGGAGGPFVPDGFVTWRDINGFVALMNTTCP